MQDVLDNQQYFEREYFNQTTLHPLALIALAVLSLLTILLPRKYALVPTLVLICFIPSAQRIVLLGLDFTLLRIMIYVGCLRVLMRGEYRVVQWQKPDTIILLYGIVTCTAYTLLWGDTGKLIQILGKMTEALGVYFFVRPVIRTWADVWIVSKVLVIVGAVVAVAFLFEKATGRNVFSVFGGVPAITRVREGHLRCTGAFAHPILAGCFWAAVAPYMAALWWSGIRNARILAVVGIASSITVILACASSTPVASFMSGILAGAWFLFRRYSRVLRYGAVCTLFALHMVMKAPVWHLISRIDITGGSTGYHRYHLIDATIRNFPEWALIGTKGTSHWGIQLFDLTNQYALEGVRGGIVGLSLFVLLILACFWRVGRLWCATEKNPPRLAMSWALGVALFVHSVSFLGVSYFGQITVVFYFAMASIVSLAEPMLSRRPCPLQG